MGQASDLHTHRWCAPQRLHYALCMLNHGKNLIEWVITLFVKCDWHTLSHTDQVGVVRCCTLPARSYVFRYCHCVVVIAILLSLLLHILLILLLILLLQSLLIMLLLLFVSTTQRSQVSREPPNLHFTCRTIGATIGGISSRQNNVCGVVVGHHVLNWQSTWLNNPIRRKQTTLSSIFIMSLCHQQKNISASNGDWSSPSSAKRRNSVSRCCGCMWWCDLGDMKRKNYFIFVYVQHLAIRVDM